METSIALATGLVLGLCQVIKTAGLNTKWIPLCGVVIGAGLSFMLPDLSMVLGIMAALSAMGLYSGTKATAK